jgi:acyl dehydratase
MAQILFEDIEVGHGFETSSRTVTETDIVNFAGLSGDFNQLHISEPWVREHTPFRGRIAHGLLGVAIVSGLYSDYLYDWDIQAFLECSRRFRAPIYAGDTIHARYTVEKMRRTSRPGAGVVRLAVEVVNQESTLVQSGHDIVLISCHTATADPGEA